MKVEYAWAGVIVSNLRVSYRKFSLVFGDFHEFGKYFEGEKDCDRIFYVVNPVDTNGKFKGKKYWGGQDAIEGQAEENYVENGNPTWIWSD